MKKPMNSRMGMKKMPMAMEEKMDMAMEGSGKSAAKARKKDMSFHKKFGPDEDESEGKTSGKTFKNFKRQ